MMERSAGSVEVMVFEVDGRRFGLARSEIVDVLRVVSLVPLPIQATLIEGMFEHDGAIVPVFKVGAESDAPARPPGGERVIVARIGVRRVALRADGPVFLMRFATQDIADATEAALETGIAPGAAEMPDKLTYIHDLRTFLSHAEQAFSYEARRLRRGVPAA